ncbi:S-layer homology domain-containing protein [Cohnella sp. GCM10027633]|uniref:S-layer homology domain-containing protein n=1 Tax=unclassified Cohnella TaxID=2636738 RepID=UPI0036308C57
MKSVETYAGWDFTSTWGIIEGSTYPLHRTQYELVTLAGLSVTDATYSSLPLNRAFAPNYGVYSAHVPYKTNEINVGAAVTGPSSVEVDNTGSPVAAVSLDPGPNIIPIKVIAPDGLNATYTLNVYREGGTTAYPHEISSAAQLAKIGDTTEGYDLTDSYKLTADIDLSGVGWTPIGTAGLPFKGEFDGDGHTIGNLKIDRTDPDTGLFGVVENAKISDLALSDVNVKGDLRVGGLTGTAIDSDISRVAVNGTVQGGMRVGGMVGLLSDSTSTLDESYSAAHVTGTAGHSGGLIGTANNSPIITDSFWDIDESGQSTSAGGEGMSTSDMLIPTMYTNWTFGPGNDWGMIEGTTYPMPYASFVRASLSGLSVTASGNPVPLDKLFDAGAGEYEAALSAPIAQASIAASVASAGATIAYTGATAGGVVDLGLGANPVEIRVTGPGNAAKGLYKLNIEVPTPEAIDVDVPANGTYGIEDKLMFTVEYSHSVDVTGTPVLPITVGSATVNATYIGKAPGHPERLQFVYTVRAGDLDTNGLAVDLAIVADSPASITALGDNVPLTLPVSPSLTGIIVEGNAPTIGLTPSTTAPTNDPVTVTVTANGTDSNIVALKWAAGTHPASYFASAGTAVSGGTFQADDNGAYTVYATDEAGNATVEAITIANIVSDLPTISLGRSPTGVTNAGVDVSITASANNEAGGNSLTALKWATGLLAAADFAADPALGTDVLVSRSFHVATNGTYTVYAVDEAANAKVETVTIANIVTQPPTLALDYNPKGAGQARVDISVTASVYDAGIGNVLAELRWAEGARAASDFADPALGADVPAIGTFSVDKNATYTVFAADAAGNTRVETIVISNIQIPSTWVPTPDPDRESFFLVPGREYKLELDGMVLIVPAGAITESMTITIKRATKEAESRLAGGQMLLADAFELTKSVPGKFGVPLRLEIQVKDTLISDSSLYYYDEAADRWIAIKSKSSGNTIAGETDHFTLFAVLPAQAELSDIVGHWAEQDIRDGVARGWVDGYPDGTFAPNRTVTRAEFAVMLGRLLGWTNGQALTFSDAGTIPEWAAEAIAGAVQAGVVGGYPDGSFRPNGSIGRTEAAVMIARAAKLTPSAAERTAFADDEGIAAWAKPLIEAGRGNGLLQGGNGNKFAPAALTTRAEAIVLLKRLDSYIRRNV